MTIDLAPDELHATATATDMNATATDESQADVDTELESSDPLSGAVPNVACLVGALRATGIPELATIPDDVVVLWDAAARVAVMEFCKGPEAPESDDWPALPEVLKQYFPDEPDEPDEPAEQEGVEPAAAEPTTSAMEDLELDGKWIAYRDTVVLVARGQAVKDALIDAVCRRVERTREEFTADVEGWKAGRPIHLGSSAAGIPIPSTALVPVDSLDSDSDSAPADATASSDAMQLPSTIVDVVTEAEFAERLDSKMDEFAADIQALDDWMTRVHAATAETDAAESEYLSLKEQASEAKKVYEAKVIALRSITRSQPGPQREFSFDGEQGAAEPSEPSTPARSPDEPAVTMSQEKLDAAADERSWRAWPLESLTSMGLQPRALKAMAGAGLETVGQLSDWQAKHGDFWIKEIKGMGKKVGDNVADVMERFWRERPDRKADAQAGAA